MNSFIHLADISGTAMNKGKARVLIQRHDLAPYGFDCGERYEILPHGFGQLILRARDDGKRKVSRVTDKRRNVVYQTIDLRMSVEEHADLFSGAEKLEVWIKHGVIMIQAACESDYGQGLEERSHSARAYN